MKQLALTCREPWKLQDKFLQERWDRTVWFLLKVHEKPLQACEQSPSPHNSNLFLCQQQRGETRRLFKSHLSIISPSALNEVSSDTRPRKTHRKRCNICTQYDFINVLIRGLLNHRHPVCSRLTPFSGSFFRLEIRRPWLGGFLIAVKCNTFLSSRHVCSNISSTHPFRIL